MKKLSLSCVHGSAVVLLNSGMDELLKSLGCTEADYKLIVGKRPWVGADRLRVIRVLEGLIHGMVDIMGLPKFQLPAEYIAAVVAIFVSPVNYFAACSWLGSYIASEDLADWTNANKPIEGMERCPPHQIFALCVEIASDEPIDKLCQSFTQKTNKALGRAMETINAQ